MTAARHPCAIIGSGNIGTDLLAKLLRSETLGAVAMVGVDPGSDGLARARKLGLEASADGIDWLVRRGGIEVAFDATSAAAHMEHGPILERAGIRSVDLTPAKRGPSVVPVVNLGAHREAQDVNLITCGGQATIPIVAAVSAVCPVAYAEIVATISSRSAGPGTRASIDAFTRTTARGLEEIGGARRGKAIIILNPAEPPILMRNTVYCRLPVEADREEIERSIRDMAAQVSSYVPGYRLRTNPVFDEEKVSIFIEVEGAGDYLPAYAGNLDIMTSAAVRVAERLVEVTDEEQVVAA